MMQNLELPLKFLASWELGHRVDMPIIAVLLYPAIITMEH